MSAQGQGMRQRSQGSHKPRPIREPNAPRSPAAQSSDSSGSSPPLDPQRSTCGSSLMPTKDVSVSQLGVQQNILRVCSKGQYCS